MQKLQLSIPDPCHESWDNMTATSNGRFCSACAKTVIDFSAMSDEAVLAYFSSLKKEKVCGRVYPDQLERVIQPMPTKNFLWRWNYILTFFLLFTKAGTAKAQKTIPKPESCLILPSPPSKPLIGDTIDTRIMVGKMIASPKVAPAKSPKTGTRTIKGKIVNQEGKPVLFASVTVTPGNSGTLSDEHGNFSIKLHTGKDKLTVSAIGYYARTITQFSQEQLAITLQQNMEKMGEVVVTAYPARRTVGMIAGGVSITRRTSVIDTVKNFFALPPAIKVFPNPARRGTEVSIQTKVKSGTYRLEVVDATGRIMSTQQVNLEGGKTTLQQKVEESWSAGNYFIKVVDTKGKTSMSSGFVITD